MLKFSSFLKIFILENDFLTGELEKYFKQQYRVLKLMPHPELYGLGSYCRFDRNKAEMIFMDVLKKYIERDEEQEERKVIDDKYAKSSY